MPKFVHIDLAADRPERAADFYRTVFGWTVVKLDGPTPYWLIQTVPNDAEAVGAGIAQRSAVWQSTTPTIEVSSADETTKAIQDAGGTIIIPKVVLPGVGQLVTFKDSEGNVLAALEPDKANPFTLAARRDSSVAR